MTAAQTVEPQFHARHFTEGREGHKINLIVIHDMEAPEHGDTAEVVARWMAGPTAPQSSVHACVDNNSLVRTVNDANIAWHAGHYPTNQRSLGIEHAGYAKQTRTQWLDQYGKDMLEISAKMVAAWCDHYGIPAVWLSSAEVKAGKAGICSHHAVTEAFHIVGGHTDPGPFFPVDYYIAKVHEHLKPKPKA